MDFARRQLEKYGWKEGNGLGKHSIGIKTALKPALKFDNAGVGFNASEGYTNNWWEKLYNETASNINVTNSDNNGNTQISTKKSTPTHTLTSSEYKSFIKTSKLTENGIVNFADTSTEAAPVSSTPCLKDEDLFAACGGRTAHKGARHGCKLSGKLSRLEMQEKILLKKLNNVSISDNNDNCNKKVIEKKLKKIEYHKNKNRLEDAMEIAPPTSPCIFIGNSPYKGNKKRKGERKNVSFSDTVVEFHTQESNEPETSKQKPTDEAMSRPPSPIVTIRQLKLGNTKDSSPLRADNELDEGIDCNDYSSSKCESKCDLQEKIRRDNRRMKRKLKKLRKLNNPVVFNVSLDLDNGNHHVSEKSELVKRKLFDSSDMYIYKKAKRSNLDGCQKLTTELELPCKQQSEVEDNIDTVTNSFDNVCKI
ncbi:G patch domain-containing protein 4-like [Photinus pyralis]|uniref:G patch domain-containing protein 4-like n=1 Tax=Photinus pyralis TaxID=7054 RepID=UPI0012676809|nr:G patch domain-containing protein 4-like [Photinus pyralis]